MDCSMRRKWVVTAVDRGLTLEVDIPMGEPDEASLARVFTGEFLEYCRSTRECEDGTTFQEWLQGEYDVGIVELGGLH